MVNKKTLCILTLTLAATATLLAHAQEVAADDPTIALPPLTLKIENATPQELAQALSKALNTPITTKPPAAPGTALAKITLNADKKSLWDIVTTLHTYGITLIDDPANSGYALTWPATPAPPATQRSHTWAGFHSTAGTLERRANDLHFTWTTLTDPRIAPASVAKVIITAITDNENTNLLQNTKPTITFQPTMTRVLQGTLTIPYPAKPATTATIKGEIHYVLGDNRDVVVPLDFKEIPFPR